MAVNALILIKMGSFGHLENSPDHFLQERTGATCTEPFAVDTVAGSSEAAGPHRHQPGHLPSKLPNEAGAGIDQHSQNVCH
jgi:hypothetical protein